jgi:hypothetical protein
MIQQSTIDIVHTKPQNEREIHFTQANEVYNGSCEEINILCIDYIPNGLSYLDNIINKLAFDGKIIVIGTDLIQAARKIFTGIATLKEIEQSMYSGRYMIYKYEDISKIVLNKKLKIEYANVGEINYNLVGRRTLNG